MRDAAERPPRRMHGACATFFCGLWIVGCEVGRVDVGRWREDGLRMPQWHSSISGVLDAMTATVSPGLTPFTAVDRRCMRRLGRGGRQNSHAREEGRGSKYVMLAGHGQCEEARRPASQWRASMHESSAGGRVGAGHRGGPPTDESRSKLPAPPRSLGPRE